MPQTVFTSRTPSRLTIAAMCYLMVQAVMFGFPTILALTFWPDEAETLIPAIVVVSAMISLPVSWFMAPSLRARFEVRSEPEVGFDDMVVRH